MNYVNNWGKFEQINLLRALDAATFHTLLIEIMCNDINKNENTILAYIPRLRDYLNYIKIQATVNINELNISDIKFCNDIKYNLNEIIYKLKNNCSDNLTLLCGDKLIPELTNYCTASLDTLKAYCR